MAAAGGRAPIFECVRAGFQFLVSDWRTILPIAAIGGAAVTPAEVWSDLATSANDGGGRLLAMAVGLLLQTPVLAAFYRRVLSRGAAPLVLRLGADEVNLVGVTVATMFVFVIAALAGLMVVAMALAALASASGVDLSALQAMPTAEGAKAFFDALGMEGRITLMGLGVVFIGFMIWLSARLALASAASVDAGRVRVFETWSWTKGNTGPVAAVLLMVLALGVALVTLAVAAPAALTAAILGKEALSQLGGPAHWLLTYLSAVAAYMFFHAPLVGATTYLYQGLKPAATPSPVTDTP